MSDNLADVPVGEEKPVNLQDRITVVLQVHHEHRGEATKSVDLRYSECLGAYPPEESPDREAYQRRVNIGKEWKQINCGWLDGKVGQVVIHHLKEDRQSIPTPEDQKKLDAKAVEVNFGDTGVAHVTIPPGQCFFFRPVDIVNVMVRCNDGTVPCRIHVFPK